MRYRLGRIGVAEAACAAAIAMCANGLFGVDQTYAYSAGNSTYISIPLSALLSLCVFLLLCASMKSSGASDLWQLLERSLGTAVGIFAALTICVSLLICACVPIGNLTHVLDDLVFEGVEFPVLLAFLLPTAAFLAFKGLETIGRTAKCYAALLVLSLIAAAASSVKGFESYRFFPIVGDGLGHMLCFSASEGVCFLPPLTALLIFGDGLQGVEHSRKAGIRAALASAAVCLISQLMLAGLYTYRGLSEIFMPLCRVNYLGIERSYVMWLDKLLVMAWLNAGMISAAYCVYAAALLFARAFGQRDVTPAVAFMTLAVCVPVLAEFEFGLDTAAALYKTAMRIGVLTAFVPAFIASVTALIKNRSARGIKV